VIDPFPGESDYRLALPEWAAIALAVVCVAVVTWILIDVWRARAGR